MPRLFLVALVAAVVLAGPTIYVQSRDREHGHIVRVMTLNAHAGVDARGSYDLPRLAHAIAEAHPDIVGMQELTRNHAEYHCDDQPALLATLLQQITGRAWSYAYVKEWVTTHRQCIDSGRGDGVETEGLTLLAPEPLTSVDHVQLWNGRIGLSARLTSVPRVAFVVTHLASGVQGQKDRVRQLDTLLPWVESRGRAIVFIGDFNAIPDAQELQPVLARFRDSWADAEASRHASGPEATHSRWRIDYVFYKPGDRLELERAEVIDTSALFGVAEPEVSDHRPVVASFRVRP